jgi:cobalt/nickel transport system permease protein
MMFNVPIPDGTSAHAVGGAMIAVCLGPWAACIAVSVALLFQALLFGDGGVLAYGVNVVNMAVVLPFVAIAVYRLVAGRQPLDSKRRVVAAGVAGYVGLTAAGLATGIELGVQPGLFTDSSGAALYSPYHLSQAVPAMLLAHLTVAGFAEAILAAGVFAYLQRADISTLVPNHPTVPLTSDGSQPRKSRLSATSVALGFVAVMVLLTPLGLLAPGGAFGEDAPEDLDLAGLGLSAIPKGLEQYNSFWSHTLLRDYGFGDADSPVVGYLVSAVVGIAVVGAAIFLIGRLVQVLGRRQAAEPANTGASQPSA